MKPVLYTGFLATVSLAASSGYYKKEDVQVEVPKFPEADLDALYRSGGSFKGAKRAEFGAIRDAQETILTPTRSIDSLFLRLPSATQLDELVLSADSVSILKTIQTVATDDSIPCDQRIAYLLQVLGRLRSAIELKTFAAEQLKVIIDGALEQIKRLEDEIDRLQDEKKSLWLDELRSKLKDLVNDLEDVYNKFNAVEAQIPIKEAQVAGYEKEIQILTKSSDSERNRIAQDKLKLTETEAIIRDLENQLKAARDRKATLEASIRKSEKIIDGNDKKIADARAEVRRLEKEIDDLQDKTDALRAKYTELQIKVERLRTDISVAEAKEDRINAEIDRIVDRINFQKEKIAQDELDDLNNMIRKLKDLVPTTEKEIDRHYYYCYGEGSVQVEKTGDVVVYIIRGERFGDYLHNAYGKSVKVPSLQRDVHLHRVDVFGPAYTNKYGYPFVNTSHHHGNDFSCLNPSAAHKGYGQVERIEGSTVYVNAHDGERTQLHIGSCSRVEAVTQVPKVGQSIYYSGVPSSAGGYNLYTATCV